MSRAEYWALREGKTLCVSPFCVMGIVNLTPDSFYDGGAYCGVEDGLRRALRLLRQGAHILDLGAESSRPGAKEISAEEEQERLLPVLRALKAHPQGKRSVVSVDTYRASTARAALEAGADIINDISACAFDPALRETLKQYKPGYVLMHCRGRPESMQDNPRYGNVVEEVFRFFECGLELLSASGLEEEKIVLDPGIGFGKRLEDNLALLRGLERFSVFGRPLLTGLSMKSFLGELLGLGLAKRGPATQTAAALLYARGAALHRAHDVGGTLRALRLAEALRED